MLSSIRGKDRNFRLQIPDNRLQTPNPKSQILPLSSGERTKVREEKHRSLVLEVAF